MRFLVPVLQALGLWEQLEPHWQFFAGRHRQAYYFLNRPFQRPTIQRMPYPKVFVIGGPKTGTTSVALCLTLLGFRHKSYDEALSKTYATDASMEPLRPYLERFHSFDDNPWNCQACYRDLDRLYPGAKFIYTWRDQAAWLRSHQAYFQKGSPYVPPDAWIEPYDPAEQWAQFTARNKGILDYFADRPGDLLEWNVTADPRWEPLCDFLSLPLPRFSFPHANQRRA